MLVVSRPLLQCVPLEGKKMFHTSCRRWHLVSSQLHIWDKASSAALGLAVASVEPARDYRNEDSKYYQHH